MVDLFDYQMLLYGSLDNALHNGIAEEMSLATRLGRKQMEKEFDCFVVELRFCPAV
ncbi:hypothetical protein [Xanthomonas translucens]|uniref:Uncharacterized protein n=1 Tax=Xanthomonas translucens pv. translucens TaxID=134875 RepID=A0ABW9KSP1_XANCT|nr:hypothetical protein [Xanthomonas translucens]MBC3973125.1 hypothetical protein [Xanthomonas translucens pv. undulosa]MCC8445623.1 hypothetical protein [Xanthomonas translucens pv. translucens]MCS3361777.1 hypothetical protein [Xanthomonas translucens pv. translucens]MCS3373499.1 hypothetical protein [Xanthomonas translucens pv. translucens]MCT8269912.1 hypothetical protein [Xanthomonas translucens pv. undulosa]